MLKYTRLIMFILLNFVMYSSVPNENVLLKVYITVAAIIFIVNHFIIFSSRNKQLIGVLIYIDALLSFSFGFVFPGSTLYLILLGVVSVTFYIHLSNKKVFQFTTILFLILWMCVMFYWKKETGSFQLLDNIISFSFILFCAVVGDLIRKLLAARETMDAQYGQLNDSHAALSDAHDQLRHYSKRVEELTAIHERNRIAREIHDTVGHKMTALLVQLELGKEWLKYDTAKAGEVLQVCDELARGALEEIRFSVRTLHHDESERLTLIPSIRKLLEDYYQNANLEAVFELKGDPSFIPISLQLTMIRIIQESLTNAKRHGGASSFFLEISCSAQEITLITKDNGGGVNTIEPGFGLINMRERIEEHGGSVLYESSEGEGFQMRVTFPLLHKKWMAGAGR